MLLSLILWLCKYIANVQFWLILFYNKHVNAFKYLVTYLTEMDMTAAADIFEELPLSVIL